jgi:hypothetical protein
MDLRVGQFCRENSTLAASSTDSKKEIPFVRKTTEPELWAQPFEIPALEFPKIFGK